LKFPDLFSKILGLDDKFYPDKPVNTTTVIEGSYALKMYFWI